MLKHFVCGFEVDSVHVEVSLSINLLYFDGSLLCLDNLFKEKYFVTGLEKFGYVSGCTNVSDHAMGVADFCVHKFEFFGKCGHQRNKKFDIFPSIVLVNVETAKVKIFPFSQAQKPKIIGQYCRRIIGTIQKHGIKTILKFNDIFLLYGDLCSSQLLILFHYDEINLINAQPVLLDDHVCGVKCEQFRKTCDVMLFLVLKSLDGNAFVAVVD